MAKFHVFTAENGAADHPVVRRIGLEDILDALRRGFDDFWVKPSHYAMAFLIYPVAGVILATWAAGGNALQLVYPLVTGFALLGPIAAIGLYEISRRREAGLDASWVHAFEVRKSPAIPSILAVGAMLIVLFIIWLYTAQALYVGFFGPDEPESMPAFLFEVVTTLRGWTFIVVGNLVGFLFALVVLSTSVIAFPLLLDRDVGATEAVKTSARAVLTNPVPMLLWGLIVAVTLVLGSLPFLVGLAIVLPVLGHATWHVYRKLVVPPSETRPVRP